MNSRRRFCALQPLEARRLMTADLAVNLDVVDAKEAESAAYATIKKDAIDKSLVHDSTLLGAKLLAGQSGGPGDGGKAFDFGVSKEAGVEFHSRESQGKYEHTFTEHTVLEIDTHDGNLIEVPIAPGDWVEADGTTISVHRSGDSHEIVMVDSDAENGSYYAFWDGVVLREGSEDSEPKGEVIVEDAFHGGGDEPQPGDLDYGHSYEGEPGPDEGDLDYGYDYDNEEQPDEGDLDYGDQEDDDPQPGDLDYEGDDDSDDDPPADDTEGYYAPGDEPGGPTESDSPLIPTGPSKPSDSGDTDPTNGGSDDGDGESDGPTLNSPYGGGVTDPSQDADHAGDYRAINLDPRLVDIAIIDVLGGCGPLVS